MFYGVQITHKDLKELAKQLGWHDNPMGIEWFDYREKHPHTRIAYSKNKYGICAELYYLKDTHEFILI